MVALFITNLQRIVIAGLDFDMLRVVILFGMARVFLRGELTGFRPNNTDRIFLLWIAVRTLANAVLQGDMGGLTHALGYAYTALGCYFLVRLYVRSMDDVRVVVRALAVLSVPVALFMLNEQVTGRNVFSVFGGVPRFTPLREGRLRSQGAFSHPILAGSFGASLPPLMWGLWAGSGRRVLPAAGAAAGAVITFASASSGPFMALIAGFFAAAMWPIRRRYRQVIIAVLVTMAGLQLAMSAPIWALLWRVSVVSGSKGWHRYILIDQFIRRAGEWWLVGVESTAHWGYGLWDVTNRYVREGVDAGMASLLLFIGVMVSAYVTVLRTGIDESVRRNDRIMVWALGASLFVHVVSFIGVSYFGQMMFFWYLPVAMISSARSQFLAEPQAQAEQQAQEEPRNQEEDAWKAYRPAPGWASSGPPSRPTTGE
ncbi:MAG: hypothetical protein ACOC8N_01575 [Spirochaetota bacterium]